MGLLGLIFGTKRATIGGVTIDAVVKSTHSHIAQATENPVEGGVTMTDHVALKPFELTIDGIVTDTPVTFSVVDSVKGLIETTAEAFGKKSRSIEAYDALVKLMNDRIPFKVVTGLKVYDQMVLEDLTVDREASTGKALKFTARMKQIRIAKAKTSGGGSIVSETGIPSDDVKDLASSTSDIGGQFASKAEDGSIFGNAISGSAIAGGAESLFTVFAGLA